MRESLTSASFPLTASPPPVSPPPSLPSSSLGTTRPGVFRRYGELSQPRPGLCDRVDSHLQCLPREPLCCGTNGDGRGGACSGGFFPVIWLSLASSERLAKHADVGATCGGRGGMFSEAKHVMQHAMQFAHEEQRHDICTRGF